MWYVCDVCLLFYYCIYWTSSLLIKNFFFDIATQKVKETKTIHIQWWQKESGPSAILSKKEQTRVKQLNKSRKTVNLYLKYNMYK